MTSVTPSGNLDQQLPAPSLTRTRQHLSGRRRFLSALAGSAGAVAGVGIIRSATSPTVAAAQSSIDPLIGSWTYEIVPTRPDGTPAPIPHLKGLITVHADNTVVDSFTEAAVTPAPPRATTGHGVWAALDSGAYAFTELYYRVNESGIYDRTVTLQAQLSLAADGSGWSGMWSTVTTDGSGARIGTNQGTFQGSRIQLPS